MSPFGQAGAAALFAVAVLSIGLGQGSILSSDDALYAQMAREMAERDAWLTAYWLGEAVFEKPPILLWLLRLIGPIFDWSDLALRLPGVLAAGVCVYFGGRFVLTRTTGWLAALSAPLMMLCTVTFCFNARRPMTDMLLCAAVLGSLWSARQILSGDGDRGALMLGLIAGLGVMTKSVAMGPAVVAVGLMLALARQYRAIALALGVGLLVVSPWHIAMSLQHGPVFWDVYLGYHIGERISGPLVGTAPWTTYLETLWSLDGLWGVMLLSGLVLHVALDRGWTQRLISAAAMLTLIVVHASSTRLYHYFLPVVVLASVATAFAVQRHQALRWGALSAAVIGVLIGPLYPTLLAPDYAPSSRIIAERVLVEEPDSTRVILWEDYDPALVWYAKRPIRIWTADEGFWAVQQSIDMMVRTNAVTFATEDKMRELARDPRRLILVARSARSSDLLRWAESLRSQRQVTIDTTSSEARVVVKVEESS